MNRNLLSNLATGVLVACALAMTAAVVRREFFPPRGGPDMRSRRVDNWQALTSAGQWLGDPRAPVRIVEFSDFQCPFCASLQPALRALERRYGDRLNVVYRNYPLESIHPYARTAAVAAECADFQGAFRAYHDALFARQDQIGVAAWRDLAAAAGVRDLERFDGCVRSRETDARVADDLRLGGRIALTGTPTLIINGMMMRGSLTEARIAAQIDQAMKSAPGTRTASR